MHGVGETLAGLADFVGLRFIALDDLGTIVFFRFANPVGAELRIDVESEWTLFDRAGFSVATGAPRPNASLPEPPLGAAVVAAETQPPTAIVLTFASGHRLQILDDSEQHESFSIPHCDVFI